MVVSRVCPRKGADTPGCAAREATLYAPNMTCIVEPSNLHEARQAANRGSVARDCAITRLPGGELRTRVEMIATVVRLTAQGTVNCPNAPLPHRDCAFAAEPAR